MVSDFRFFSHRTKLHLLFTRRLIGCICDMNLYLTVCLLLYFLRLLLYWSIIIWRPPCARSNTPSLNPRPTPRQFSSSPPSVSRLLSPVWEEAHTSNWEWTEELDLKQNSFCNILLFSVSQLTGTVKLEPRVPKQSEVSFWCCTRMEPTAGWS